jgi:hypothetical protein
MASNNWWGAASGPQADGNCNPGGTGSRVSANVVAKPFLTSANQVPGVLAPSDARILTITPRRWFAPADNFTRVWVTMTLRDGNGVPMPNRKINLASNIGRVESGGNTDATGQTLAYLTSSAAGDAELVGALDATSCESARSAVAKVTFTAPVSGSEFLPEEAAPYVNEGIKINPEPIVRGVPTKMSAKLVNPNDYPIVVDGTFGFAQLGIGLAFGPAGEVIGQVIPAKSTGEVSINWLPVVNGKYCVQFLFTARKAVFAANGKLDLQASKINVPLAGGRSQKNLFVNPGPLGPPNEKDSLDKADKAMKLVWMGKKAAVPGPSVQIHKAIISKWWDWVKDTAREISKNLGSDPPRQDYTVIAIPKKINLPPVTSDGQLSAARVAAINAVTDAMLDMNAKGEAATITLDRYGGAAAAKNLEWSSTQAASLIFYKFEYGQALITAALRLDELVAVAASEGVTSSFVTADDIRAYQAQVSATGFTESEIQDAKAVGLTDAQIEAHRNEILAADPETSKGDVITYLKDLASAYRNLGVALTTPQNFGFSISGGGGGLFAPEAVADNQTAAQNLVRVFNLHSDVQVGNPFTQSVTMTLQPRRISLPGDWLVQVSPITVTLAPGEQITAMVTIIPGGATVQGSVARVAVEGYVGAELVGGVAVDMLVPQYVRFDGKLRAYLPLVRK